MRRFIAPAAYVQGPGTLDDLAEHVEFLDGDRAYVLGGTTALSATADAITDGFDAAGIDVAALDDDVTACTRETIDHYAARAADCGADVVVGVGGGVAIDVATAVATDRDVEFVSVPTIASTDAPCSTVSVVYDDAGNFRETILRDRNPDLVLVDTRVIAAAPTRFLRHGMGDTLATRFEAEASMRSNGSTVAGGRSSYAALAIAEEGYRRIAEHGPAAIAACDRDAVTPAFERAVEANVLLSGLGFESAGTAGAHAVQIGLTNVGVREPHGVLVGFGTIAELLLQDRQAALEDALDVVRSVDLDATLDELGVADDDLDRVGEIACENGMENEPVPADPDAVADAVRAADELLRERRA